MSAALDQNTGSPTPWRKRARDELDSRDIKELKRPRYYYFRLESESSKASEDDTESICSLQGKDTDVVRDTSDTESQAESEKNDEYELEFEYEVASLSESDEHGIVVSSSDSDGMMLAAAAAVMCDSSIEAWVTDGEDSDSSSDETSFGRTDFSTCVQCKGENDNPLYRYCEKCFQSCRQCKMHKTYKCFPLCQSCYKDRKKFFPPRPRRNRRKNAKINQNPVKLDTLRNCLSGLSQDSGIGSSQECPSLGLDQIVVPEYLQSPGMSKSEDNSNSHSKSLVLEKIEETELDTSKPKTVYIGNTGNGKEKRKRQCSESSLSDFEVKKPKIDLKPESTSDLGSEVSSTSSFPSIITEKYSFSPETSGFISEKEKPIATFERSNSQCSEKAETELCMFCNSAPKDSIFLHTNIAHRCCCYKCAKKTLKTIKRCPICNRSVNKVVRIFTS